MEKILEIKLTGLRQYLLQRAYMRFLRPFLKRSKFTTIKVNGIDIEINRNDLEQVYLETDCVREPENIFLYRAFASSGLCSTFIDVGANYGHVALKVAQHYQSIHLIDANPNAAQFLSKLFSNSENVVVHNKAITNSEATTHISLAVPKNSSGLAHLATNHEDAESDIFQCPATTLDKLSEAFDLSSPMYLKIDVEGMEEMVIEGAPKLISKGNVIVGFEALSMKAAKQVASHFKNHTFYFGRFDFLNPTGALTKSLMLVLKAFLFGGNISYFRSNSLENCNLDNFSQIIAVPNEITGAFETSIHAASQAAGCVINLHNI